MPNLHEIFLALRSPDTYPVLDTIRYALAGARLNRKAARRKRSYPPVLPGSLTGCTIIPQGGLFTFENSQLEVTFLAPDLVRLSWMKAGNVEPPLPYAIAKTEWSPHDVSLVTTPEQTTLTSSVIELCITSDGTTVFSSSERRSTPRGRAARRAAARRGAAGRVSERKKLSSGLESIAGR